MIFYSSFIPFYLICFLHFTFTYSSIVACFMFYSEYFILYFDMAYVLISNKKGKSYQYVSYADDCLTMPFQWLIIFTGLPLLFSTYKHAISSILDSCFPIKSNTLARSSFTKKPSMWFQIILTMWLQRNQQPIEFAKHFRLMAYTKWLCYYR